MPVSHDELRRAVALTWKYVDATAEGARFRHRSRLPTPPEAIEEAVALVLWATRDPIGRVALVRVAPETSSGLLMDDTPAMLEGVLKCLPQFLPEEDFAVRAEFDRVTGARFTPAGDYDLSQPPRTPPVSDFALVQKYMAIQDRVVSEGKSVVERARSRQYMLASESAEGTRSRERYAGREGSGPEPKGWVDDLDDGDDGE